MSHIHYIYKDGSKRVIRVEDVFFLNFKKQPYNTNIIEDKALELGEQCGGKVYQMKVVRDRKYLVNYTNRANKPYKEHLYFKEIKGIFVFKSLSEIKKYLKKIS